VAREVRRLIAVISRYLDDSVLYDEVEAISGAPRSAWERRAIDLRETLRLAVGCLDHVADDPVQPSIAREDPGCVIWPGQRTCSWQGGT
jgi:hypothetical protein